ncbi:MAG: hypothetical protein OHK0015_30690 [Chloroflexi bacterium OHK40]
MGPAAWSAVRSGWQGQGARYGVALLMSVLALVLSCFAAPFARPAIFIFFYLAVVASALYGGWGPGLVTAGLSVLAMASSFLMPLGLLALDRPGVLDLLIFVLAAAFTVGLAELRRRSEQRARELSEQYQVILGSIGDALIVTDVEGRILLINPMAEALTGCSAAEALGRPADQVFQIVNARSRQPVASPIAQAIAEGRTVGLANHTLLIARDGTERLIDDSGAPMRGPDGRLRGVVLVFRDVTERERAAAALQASRDQLEAILHGVADGITAQQPGGQLIYANDAAARVAGFATVEELLAAPPGVFLERFELFDEAGRPFPIERLPGRRVLGGESTAEALIRFRERATGSERWSLVKATGLRDARGQVQLAINLFHDITAQKQAERAAARSAERAARLQALTAALAAALTPAEIAAVVLREGLAAVDGDAGSIFLLTPEGDALELLHAVGYPEALLAPARRIALGDSTPPADTVRSCGPIYVPTRAAAIERWPALAAVHPHIPWHAWAYLPLLIDGRAIGSLGLAFQAEQHFDPPVQHFLFILAQQCSQAFERARLFAAERAARARAETVQRRVSFIADITANLSAALDYPTRLRELVRMTVPTLGDFCIVYEQAADGRITRMAAAHHDPAQEPILQRLQAEDRIDPNGPNPVARVFRTGEAAIATQLTPRTLAPLVESPIQREAAQLLQPRAYMIFPLTARGRTVGAMSFILTDPARSYDDDEIALAAEVAQRAALSFDNARLYQEAQEAIRLRDQFLSIAAHELKTPLTALLGTAQLLQRRDQREGLLGPRERRSVEVIVNQTNRLSAMVTTLLDIARLETGHLGIERERFDICALVRRIVDELDPSLEGRILDLQCPTSPLMILGDALRLEQVFQNLLQNAFKYSPETEPVSIEVRQQHDRVAISVRDRGIGIPAAAQPQLFQRFFRASNVEAGQVQGMGIGLYVVREIVTLHEGTISVESVEGQGSTFTVILPLAPPA